ncbi:o-succinylbenzoate synthase [Corynebacterium bovis]|uniref:o-succinylbenzoate synthase n=1 Tax=Corynebacterium bovis TaxID=36808 RepID=UPI00244C63E8|nr:o-succinylbenzoate synthase [Corynebacterium bovis]MDH2455723.1 o-succinylbenzoate synthase [Corynebacterium bovis]
MPKPHAESLCERAHVVRLPLRVRFRGVETREVVLIDAPRGWVEWSPFPEYDDAEAARWLRCAVGMGWGGPAVGAGSTGGGAQYLRDAGAPDPVTAPVSPLSVLGAAPGRRWVEVNATVPAVDVAADPEAVPRLLARYPGCRTVKVKVAEKGQTLDDDVARVNAVRSVMEEAVRRGDVEGHPRVRVDANGGWTVDEALAAAEALTQTGPVDYLEQPCRTAAELAGVRRGLMRRGLFVRVAADELIRRAEDPLAVVRAGACDVAVVKAAPLGGVDRVLEVAEEVAAYGVAVTVSSALESAVGIGAGLAAAAGIPERIDDDGMVVPPQPAGLATGSLFVEDVCAPRPIVDGRLEAVAVAPDADRLESLAVDGATRDRWLDRLRRAHAHL